MPGPLIGPPIKKLPRSSFIQILNPFAGLEGLVVIGEKGGITTKGILCYETLTNKSLNYDLNDISHKSANWNSIVCPPIQPFTQQLFKFPVCQGLGCAVEDMISNGGHSSCIFKVGLTAILSLIYKRIVEVLCFLHHSKFEWHKYKSHMMNKTSASRACRKLIQSLIFFLTFL